MPIYVAGDVRAIQGYVFASPQLLEMRGGSALIDFYDRSVVPHQVDRLGGDLVSSGGGNFLAVFDGGDAAGRVEKLRRLLHGAFFDLTSGREVLIETLETGDAFPAAQTSLHEKLQRAKQRPGNDRQLASMPFLRRCESCGREAADVADRRPGGTAEDRQWLGPACARKRRTHKALVTARNERRPARLRVYGVERALEVPPVSKRLDGVELPSTFEDLVGGDDLAILVADGNGLGGWFRGLPTAADYRGLSERVDRALREALDAAVGEVFNNGDNIKVQVLICGGDDLVVALPARFAARFACKLIETFDVEPPAGQRETGLAAGLLIAKLGFPFRHGHALAVELLGWAKRRCREEEGVRSALQLHRVTASHAQSLEHELERLERRDTLGHGWAYGMAGPYTPPELRDLIALTGELRAGVTPSQRGRLREILSPRDDSRESPLHERWRLPKRALKELEGWRVRQEVAPFTRPLDEEDVARRYLRTEPARPEDGATVTYRRWVLADALTLAALGEG